MHSDLLSSNSMKHFYMLNSNNEYKEVTSIEIPDTITNIGNYQFYGFDNITSITIPSSITTIGDSAFQNCKSLTSITIPNSVTTINGCPFFGDFKVKIYCEATSQPSGWDSLWNFLGGTAYYGITKDNKIEKDGIIYVIQNEKAIVTEYIGNDTNITIPDTIELNGKIYTVATIGDYAFSSTYLTDITIPNSVTTIENGAFFYCEALTNITISSSVTTIGNRTFEDCTSLTSIIIPSSVTTIGEDVFEGCSSLTIYCEAASQPSDWNPSWNPDERPVVWDYKI